MEGETLACRKRKERQEQVRVRANTTRKGQKMWSMAKGLRLLAVVAVVGMTLAPESGAQTVRLPSDLLQAAGKITSLDVQRGAVKLVSMAQADQPSSESPITFFLAAETQISQGIKRLKPEQLKVGDQIVVEYSAKDGKNTAHSITVQEPTGAERNMEGKSEVPSRR